MDEFREIASQVPADQPVTYEQYQLAAPRFRRLVDVLGSLVRDEWVAEIDRVLAEVASWADDLSWRSRHETKSLSETLIGEYDASQLLIFDDQNLYVLAPMARFVAGAQGALDLSIQPSFFLTTLYRDDQGQWRVNLEPRDGASPTGPAAWNRDAFLKCIDQLKVSA